MESTRSTNREETFTRSILGFPLLCQVSWWLGGKLRKRIEITDPESIDSSQTQVHAWKQTLNNSKRKK